VGYIVSRILFFILFLCLLLLTIFLLHLGQSRYSFGTYTDDRDVVAKHEQEETDAAALALLQKTHSETD